MNIQAPKQVHIYQDFVEAVTNGAAQAFRQVIKQLPHRDDLVEIHMDPKARGSTKETEAVKFSLPRKFLETALKLLDQLLSVYGETSRILIQEDNQTDRSGNLVRKLTSELGEAYKPNQLEAIFREAEKDAGDRIEQKIAEIFKPKKRPEGGQAPKRRSLMGPDDTKSLIDFLKGMKGSKSADSDEADPEEMPPPVTSTGS